MIPPSVALYPREELDHSEFVSGPWRPTERTAMAGHVYDGVPVHICGLLPVLLPPLVRACPVVKREAASALIRRNEVYAVAVSHGEFGTAYGTFNTGSKHVGANRDMWPEERH